MKYSNIIQTAGYSGARNAFGFDLFIFFFLFLKKKYKKKILTSDY